MGGSFLRSPFPAAGYLRKPFHKCLKTLLAIVYQIIGNVNIPNCETFIIYFTVHTHILVGRFHARMKICLHEDAKGAPII